MKRHVIARKYLPANFPLFPTITLWLLADRLQMPATAQAVMWTVWAFFCSAWVYTGFTEKTVHPSEIPIPKVEEP